MSERIQIPYSFNHEENKIIDHHFSCHEDWEKPVFNEIKKRIIEHLRVQQENRCCYCKRELGFDIKDVDIEHVIPKSKYAIYTFYSYNLALSCPGCNTKKSHKDVLDAPAKRYPRSPNRFIIVHPHYDNYSDHIHIIDECVYIPVTSKGCRIIEFCELFRLKKVFQNAQANRTSRSNLSKIIEELRQGNNSEVKAFVAEIKNLIK